MKTNRSKELLKNTIIIFAGKFSTQFLNFLLLPIFTNFLANEEYGTIDLIITYLTLLVPIVTLQIESGTFRFLIDNRNNRNKCCDILKSSFKIILKAFLFILCLSVVLLCFYRSKLLLISVACIFAMIISNYFLQVARGFGKNNHYSICSIIIGVSNIIFNYIFIIKMHVGGIGILYSTFISNSIGILYLIFMLDFIRMYVEGNNDVKLQKQIISFSWPLVPNTISWWLINTSDRTIVTIFLGAGANGIYAISTKFSSIISSLITIFSLSWTESASLHINDNDVSIFFSKINDSILRISSSICLFLLSFMPIIFTIFIGPDYYEAYKYIPINIIASFFSCFVSIYSSIYIAKKMTKKVASTSFMAASINIVVDLLLIRYVGLFAASISSAVAYIIMSLYRAYDLRKYVKIKYDVKLLIFIVIDFLIVILLYYLNNKYLNYISIIISIISIVYMNMYFIKIAINKIFQKKSICGKGN